MLSFDVITFKSGTFDLKGDGGFENWAYIVDGSCTADAKAKHISCA
jgi:acyl-CoA-binding protein